jgi:2-oxoglutarate dehydrogenase E2 component (dihydrolipoamide succinyltransferase)
MAIDIVVPELGESVSEGTVGCWLKQLGEAVGADEPLVELETDKATLEISSPKAGVLSEILVPEGEDVEIGAVLGRIEEGAVAAPRAPAPEAPSPLEEPSSAASPAADLPASRPSGPTDRTRSTPTDPSAGTHSLDPETIGRSGSGERVSLPDLLGALDAEGVDVYERSGPAVRKLVAEHGLDPSKVPASGRDGRLSREDVQRYLSQSPKVPESPDVPVSTDAPPVNDRAAGRDAPREERVKMSRMRRTIAARLKEAQNTAAILTTFNEVDMGAVRSLRARHRERFEERHGVRLGFTSFFVKASVAALQEIPDVNAQIDGDEIVQKHYYDIGVAVAAPAGLLVPVVRDCDRKSFAEIERDVGDLAGRARDGKLSQEEMSGGTFSITNGGVFGSMLSTPILNRPQSAILGLHKLQDRPIAVDGEVVIRPMMYLALSYDHRIVDGKQAVTFLVKIKECIEDPERLLLEV